MPFGFRLSARRNLDQMRIVFQRIIRDIDDRPAAAFAGPRPEFDRAKVAEGEIADDADALLPLPFLVEIREDEVLQRTIRLWRADHFSLVLLGHNFPRLVVSFHDAAASALTVPWAAKP